MRLGIIGLGTVGRSVIEILEVQREKLKDLFKEDVEIVKISNRSKRPKLEEKYDFSLDYLEVVNSSKVDTVVELIGGVTDALEIARLSLKNKKNLITANKHLLALHGKELFKLAKENQVKLFFEASIAGGIPVVTPLKEGLFPNDITLIRGILNGTANYILQKMEEGLDFEKALEDASIKGYAEADPSFDIDGIDTAHKISLLGYLAFNEFINFENIGIKGISQLTLEDIENARKSGKRYKLIGSAVKVGNDVKVEVKPVLIDKDELLYSVNGVYNAVEVKGSFTGTTVFYGKGAGGNPTGSAVISDLYKVVCSRSWN